MKKSLIFVIFSLILAIFSGCRVINNNGNYVNFTNRQSNVTAGSDQNHETVLMIYSVYPQEAPTEGKIKIQVYGQGFERDTKVFLNLSDYRLETFVFNPGYLEAWVPPHYAGMFILGVINSSGSTAKWSRLFQYK